VWEGKGWTAIVAEGDWQQRLRDEFGNHAGQEQENQEGQK
jgi:hypothetical protein